MAFRETNANKNELNSFSYHSPEKVDMAFYVKLPQLKS